MEFTERELEMLSGFIGENWTVFSEQSVEFLGVNGLHRLAGKLGLGSDASENGAED